MISINLHRRHAMMLGSILSLPSMTACGGGDPDEKDPERISMEYGVLKVSSNLTQFAGAIDSIIYDGKEFVNSFDHGRLFQTALQIDGYGECFNPTEAGSFADGGRMESTSVLESIGLGDNMLRTQVRAASWVVAPDGNALCPRGAMPNPRQPTDTLIYKRIELVSGNKINWHVSIDCREAKEKVGVEILTGYLPEDFNALYSVNPKSLKLTKRTTWKLDSPNDGYPDGGTYISGSPSHEPMIWTTSDGSFALGILRPKEIIPVCEPNPSYHAFRFILGGQGPKGNSCSKFSVVSHFPVDCLINGLATFRVELFFGDLESVYQHMRERMR